ncbi:MAG: adhesin [Bacteroidota bacterium]
MAIVSRSQLKQAFEKGAIPSQEDFENLVDSMLHKQEDGMISQDDGLKLSPKGSARKMLTFYNNLSDLKPKWGIEQHPKNSPDFGLNLVDQSGESQLFIKPDGKVGLGTTDPTSKLDVAGNINMQGRRGTYATGQVPGDSEWHSITPPLNHCHAFEVVAQIGKPGRGLYSIIHATALSAFGRSSNKITKTEAHYGSFRNKIDLRWAGQTFNYYLQIRTKRNYGGDSMIKYYVTNLWWEDKEY